MPAGVFNRVADNWRPLLAIADAAGGNWPERARRACMAAAEVPAEQSVGVILLGDIQAIFAEKGVDRLPSDDLVKALNEIEGHPWAEWRGRPLTSHALARLLKKYPTLEGRKIELARAVVRSIGRLDAVIRLSAGRSAAGGWSGRLAAKVSAISGAYDLLRGVPSPEHLRGAAWLLLAAWEASVAAGGDVYALPTG